MSSMSGGQKTDSVNNGNLRTEYGNNRLVINDGSDDRLIMGQEDDGDIVFKVSQPGYNVNTATDQQLAFSSQFNSFKIIQSGEAIINKAANAQTGTASVTHNLGYAPAVIAFCNRGSPAIFDGASGVAGTSLPVFTTVQTWDGSLPGTAITAHAYFTSGTTETVFVLRTPLFNNPSYLGYYDDAITLSFKYYILAETGA